MNQRCPSTPSSASTRLWRWAARRRRAPERPRRTRRPALLLRVLGAAAVRRRRAAAARLLLHGCRCVGNGVCGASRLDISAAAHRHKSTRIPKRANSSSNRASCPFNLTSNSESREARPRSSGGGALRGAAQLPSAGLKATIWQLARPLRAEEQQKEKPGKNQDGPLGTAPRARRRRRAPRRTPQNLAAGLQRQGNPERPPLLLRFLFRSAARGPPARPRGPGTSLAPKARGGAAPGARAAAAEPAARSLGTY